MKDRRDGEADAMNGIDRSGQAVSYHRREQLRPVPPGPLSKSQVIDAQTTIAKGLAGIGYTDEQIGQILSRPLRTVERRVQGARPRRRQRDFEPALQPSP